MSLSANYPAVRPSLLLDFANSKRLDPRITFTRATTATYYDGVTTTKAEENLQEYSQGFDAWSTNLCSVTANSTTAPDGTTTADTITQTNSSGEHYVYRTAANCVAGVQTTVSVYAKLGNQNFIQFGVSNNGGLYANFNLSTGATGTTAEVTSSSITSVGNGWYRCVATFAPGASGFFFIGFVGSASASRLATYNPGSATTVFLWGAQVEQRSSVTAYTATTTLPITNYIPTLQTASSGVARFDHNPVTGESLGLFIEEARTNLCLQSEDFTTTWSAANQVSVMSNVIVAPNGTLTGDKLVADSSSNVHYIVQNVGNTAAPWTFSLYAKAGEYSRIGFSYTNTGYVFFNLLTGVQEGTVGGAITGTSITSVGNGWYRISFSSNSTASGANIGIYLFNGTYSSGVPSFSGGNGFNGVYIWGAQTEAGLTATSYIPTTTASVTRNADNIILTGTNFSSWFNNQEGTFYSEVSFPAPAYNATNTYHFEASDGTSSNRLIGYTGGNQAQLFVSALGSTQATALSANAPAPNTNYRCGFLYEPNNFALSVNGQTAVTDNSGAVPQVSRLNIAANFSSAEHLNGWMKKLAYYPQAFTTAQLQTLTTP